MAALFDAYIMVDWSAASKPVTGANSIWIGILAKDARLKLQFRAVNIETRLKAREFLEDMVGKLGSTKPDYTDGPLPEYRIVEARLRDNKLGQPKSVWQLAYTGSVGSQSLTGIPHVHALRETWPGARIWPFEFDPAEPLTEETLTDVNVVMTEIYPSLTKAKPESGETLDAAQVREIAHYYASLDEKGALSAAFSTAKSLEPAENTKIKAEEGWIPGV